MIHQACIGGGEICNSVGIAVRHLYPKRLAVIGQVNQQDVPFLSLAGADGGNALMPLIISSWKLEQIVISRRLNGILDTVLETFGDDILQLQSKFQFNGFKRNRHFLRQVHNLVSHAYLNTKRTPPPQLIITPDHGSIGANQ